MTSTNYNIGLGEQTGRPSSRVLRPPGGGHTDIFGAPEPPVKRDSGRNVSSILEGTNATVPPPSPVKPKEPTGEQPEPAREQQQPAQNQQRGKVPPGGFSSGLW